MPVHTFQKLYSDALRYFDLASETEGSDPDLAKASVNAAHQKRTTEDKWKFMLSGKKSLAVVVAQQDYILPHEDFNKLQYLYSTTNKRFVQITPLREVAYTDVSFNDNVDSDNLYAEINKTSPVKVQPTSADTIVVTSSTTEPNNPTVYIEGEDADGNRITAELGKDATSVDEFSKITYLAKTADFDGTVTVSTTGGTTLVTLATDEYAKQYSVLSFFNIPTQTESFVYRYFRTPRELTRDFDIPDLPYPHSYILVYDSLLDQATYNELDSESVNIWREKQQELLAILYQEKLEADTVGGGGLSVNDHSIIR